LFSLLSLPYLVYGRRFALYRVFQGYTAQLTFAKGNLNTKHETLNLPSAGRLETKQ
jgi:hypothetical protein